MTGISPTHDKDGELLLALSDPGQLFNAPEIDPLSRSDAQSLGVSGFQHLLSLLNMDKKRQSARTLRLLLPPDQASKTQNEQITHALHRLAELRIEQQRRELSNTYRYGWRIFGLAFVALAICLALSSLFASEFTEGMRPHLRKTLEYSFEIIGWVLMWHPIEVLLYTPLAIRNQIAALRTLSRVYVTVQADERLIDGRTEYRLHAQHT